MVLHKLVERKMSFLRYIQPYLLFVAFLALSGASFALPLHGNRNVSRIVIGAYDAANVANTCVQFQVSQGTGCAWMCNYCANALGTNNYYFTDNVCTYQTGGCVGNPLAGKTYTCCSV